MLNSFFLNNFDEFVCLKGEKGFQWLLLAVTISKLENDRVIPVESHPVYNTVMLPNGNNPNDIQEGSPKERRSPETSAAPSRSQSPRASPRSVASAPATPEEPQAGPSSQSEPQRVNLRHYAWQYE